MADYTWDPRSVDLHAMFPISGFADDTMIECEWFTPEVAKTEAGPTGDTVTEYSADRRMKIKITLFSSSVTNTLLYQAAEAKQRGPFLLKSLSDGQRIEGRSCHVSALPNPKFARSHSPLTWEITIPQARVVPALLP